ncbi:MAG: FAD-linked oxidase C-terminal domain-containing protein [Chloroflexota bacterium]
MDQTRAAQVGSPYPPLDSQAAEALAADLKTHLRGEVRFDAGSRALYTTDASNYRQLPIGVVIPRDVDDASEAIVVCRRFGAPILPRGGGTSLAGQTCNVAVVLDFSKYANRVLAIDSEQRRAWVEPGTILDDLRDPAERFQLTFGPDPATHRWCTLGGMIGNDSCGVHSLMAGKTVDNVEELEILTYDGLRLRVGRTSDEELERIIREGGRRGEIYAKLKALRDRYTEQIRTRFPKIPRRVSGYNLDQLLPENGFHVARALVGTEGTCVTVLGATLDLTYSPPARTLVVLGYPDVFHAADHITEVLRHRPIGLEGMGASVVADEQQHGMFPRALALLPDGGGWLLVEFGGETPAEADDGAGKLVAAVRGVSNPPSIRVVSDPVQQKQIWAIREAALGASAHPPGEADRWPGWEDSAVPPDRVGDYLRDLKKLLDRYGYQASLYGHFGQGCIHARISFDLISAPGIQKFLAFVNEAADLVVSYGGSLSGEHGDGQARAALLPKMFGPELVRAFGEFKGIWDPDNRMNPGKVVDPYPITADLRLGTGYNPPRLATHFRFPDDRGSFARATLRCVGVGECRKLHTGTMCPSFMVTREEKYTTRGRARLLFEMLEGQAITEGWRSEQVKDALDLCLACKGCKRECPVSVDMATYKAEFLSHYYAGRIRPPSAYAFGLIFYWARLASRAPGLANFFTRAPLLSDLAKLVLGIAPRRRIPAFAAHTFKDWFRERGARNPDKPPVILWPDTFNNYFFPGTAIAAVAVLEAAGFQVVVPAQNLCCGRPVYDFGMLDRGKLLLQQIIRALRPHIRAGVPLVGLEPSCVAVFRDELINLFPHDEDAIRLSRQSFLLSEFLADHAPGYQPPPLRRTALVHGHCHHKALMGMGAETTLLERMGLDFRVLDSGCCGMAGAFGFEKSHYDVSIGAGERVLLPAVRAAAPETLIITDGFSCREQIAQTTDRQALHLAEVLAMALQAGPADSGRREPPAAARGTAPLAISDESGG